MKNVLAAAIAMIALLPGEVSAQAFRNCVQGSIRASGFESIGSRVGWSIGPAVVCALVPVAVSPLPLVGPVDWTRWWPRGSSRLVARARYPQAHGRRRLLNITRNKAGSFLPPFFFCINFTV
jgi:hypothetical protein